MATAAVSAFNLSRKESRYLMRVSLLEPATVPPRDKHEQRRPREGCRIDRRSHEERTTQPSG
jgi:hypothetical protein